jgi:homoprotocatechuate degradation regulator HpaR
MLDFDDSLPMILYRSLDSVMPAYRELFASHNITEQQWRVLRVLWSDARSTSIELSKRTLITTPSLVGILDRLEKKKLVSRVRSTTDRRHVYVVPTASSRKLQKAVTPQLQLINDRVEASVSHAEWAALKTILGKVAAQLETASGDQSTVKSAVS